MKQGNWITELETEDISFIERFILLSGSLKDLATEYGISYPTIRLRLDRIIEKIKLLKRDEALDPFERQVRLMLADGKLDQNTFKEILAAYKLKNKGSN